MFDLIDSKIHVAIKSYKRPSTVKTISVVPFAWIWVPDSQAEQYEENYPGRIISIPDSLDGNLCRKQNAILDLAPEKTGCDWILILDDDISGIGYWEAGQHTWMSCSQLGDMIVHHFILAENLRVKLWGVNQRKDELCYWTHTPFSLLAPILGPLHGHLLPCDTRWDEGALGKDDYDYWLRYISKHRYSLRANKYHYHHDHGHMAGGFVAMRTMAVEQAGIDFLLKRYGPKVVRPGGSAGGKSAKGDNILNTLIRCPIPGT